MMKPVTFALCVIFAAILLSCSKSEGPPIPIQNIQIEATYLSEEYDIYKYVAIKRPMDATSDTMNVLLDYYEELYRNSGKVKVLVFPDAASAIQAVSDRILAELEMEDGKVIRRMVSAR